MFKNRIDKYLVGKGCINFITEVMWIVDKPMTYLSAAIEGVA